MRAQTNRLSPENRAEIEKKLSREDPVRWLASRFCTPEGRGRYTALMALNLELAKVDKLVSEPIIAQIRYQWWREALIPLHAGGPVRESDLISLLRDTDLASFVTSDALIGMVDDHERRHLASSNTPSADEPEAALHSALALALGGTSAEADTCRQAGAVLGAARRGRAPDRDAMAAIGRAARALPGSVWPALLPLVVASDLAAGRRPSDLALKARLFWAMLTGRL